MGSCNSTLSPFAASHHSKPKDVMPIDTAFKLPSPLPTWPSGGSFAKGSIDLGGGLEVCQISTFTKVWATHEGGQDNLGATFFSPSQIPTGFFMLGCYCQPNKSPQFGWVLAGKGSEDHGDGPLKKPVDYSLVWSSESMKMKQDGFGYIWLPMPPQGYVAVGHIVTSSPEKPSLDEIRCVSSDLAEQCENDAWIWGADKGTGLNVYSLRPTNRGTQAHSVSLGTFNAQLDGVTPALSLACLKNKNSLSSSMPNITQIESLMKVYSPWIYFHPEEPYLPSSVNWFFSNGALVYKQGDPKPTPVDSTGSNLPQGGSNDGAYWLDLPTDERAKEKLKRGDLQSFESYIHVKPMLGGTFTDLATWVFYPFNGPVRAKIEFVNLSLGKVGEHVGDWEHLTLRISNFTGEIWRVFFSEHSGGKWVDASELEFQEGNKFVAYASLHGHAFYPNPGLVLQGNGSLGIGIRNDTGKGKFSRDAGVRFVLVSADYLKDSVFEPPWLNYSREWGPKLTYDTSREISKAVKWLPGKLKSAVENLVKGLPKEVLGEEGPTGPKMKNNWSGDES